MLVADSARNRLVGIGFISLTFVCFTLLDGGAKWLVRALPVLEVVWLRFVTHLLFTGALLAPRHGWGLIRTRRPRLQAIRALMLLSMTAMNFTVLQYLQLAVTSSIFFSVPIIVAVLAVPMLGERLDFARWAAILVGFTGVLIIVQPFGQAFHPAMFVAIANAVLYALFNMITRMLAAVDTPEATQFLSALGATVGLAPFALLYWETPHDAVQWLVAGLLGVLGGLGHYLLALAHRYAPATVLAPFVYQQVIYMTLFGYVVFGDVPGIPVVVGAAIVVGSGLFLLLRERAKGGARAA